MNDLETKMAAPMTSNFEFVPTKFERHIEIVPKKESKNNEKRTLPQHIALPLLKKSATPTTPSGHAPGRRFLTLTSFDKTAAAFS